MSLSLCPKPVVTEIEDWLLGIDMMLISKLPEKNDVSLHIQLSTSFLLWKSRYMCSPRLDDVPHDWILAIIIRICHNFMKSFYCWLYVNAFINNCSLRWCKHGKNLPSISLVHIWPVTDNNKKIQIIYLFIQKRASRCR